jgi:large subunit ribosomal protein L9
MKVILQKTVQKLGKTGDILEVSAGYAQNALFPKGLAIPATAVAIAQLEKKNAGLQKEKDIRLADVQQALASIKDKNIIYTAKANRQGTLFSKIDAHTLAQFLEKSIHVAIDPKHIAIEGGTIKMLGVASFIVVEGKMKIAATLSVELEK